MVRTHQENVVGVRQIQGHAAGFETNKKDFDVGVFLESRKDLVSRAHAHVPRELVALFRFE